MAFLETLFTTRGGSYIIMISIVVLFIYFIRFLYGPKGILRKNLWHGIDSDNDDNENNSKTENHSKNDTTKPS